jgi:hypothetical protein
MCSVAGRIDQSFLTSQCFRTQSWLHLPYRDGRFTPCGDLQHAAASTVTFQGLVPHSDEPSAELRRLDSLDTKLLWGPTCTLLSVTIILWPNMGPVLERERPPLAK